MNKVNVNIPSKKFIKIKDMLEYYYGKSIDEVVTDLLIDEHAKFNSMIESEKDKAESWNKRIKDIAGEKINLTLKEAMDCVRPPSLIRNRVFISTGNRIRSSTELDKVLKPGVRIEIDCTYSEPLWAKVVDEKGVIHSIKPSSINTTKKRVLTFIESKKLYKSTVWELMETGKLKR